MNKKNNRILIVDTKAGNLFSLKAAIERLGFSVEVVNSPSDIILEYHAIVIPGQGRFATVLNNLQENNWPKYLTEQLDKNTPILGICVGMQIFFQSSDEDPGVMGLGWFEGQVEGLDFPKKPMVGWAKLSSRVKTLDKKSFYFVNSFAVKRSDASIAETHYGETFCAAVAKGSFVGVQFHPEKSSREGSRLINDILSGALLVNHRVDEIDGEQSNG